MFRVQAVNRLRSSAVIVLVLLLAGLVDGLSDNWVHGALLGGAAVAVWVDSRRRSQPAQRPVLRGPLSPAARLGLAGLAVAYAVGVGALLPYTWPMTVAVLVPGVGALLLAWRGPLRDQRTPAPIGRGRAAVWAVVFVSAGLWELAALLLQPSLLVGSSAHPTISYLMSGVLESWGGRAVTLALWLALGAFLLARSTRDDG